MIMHARMLAGMTLGVRKVGVRMGVGKVGVGKVGVRVTVVPVPVPAKRAVTPRHEMAGITTRSRISRM